MIGLFDEFSLNRCTISFQTRADEVANMSVTVTESDKSIKPEKSDATIDRWPSNRSLQTEFLAGSCSSEYYRYISIWFVIEFVVYG